jgi:hypothetical protein
MWEEVLVEMLRSEVGDLAISKFSDSRLLRVILVSAFQLKSEANFPDYEVNISNGTISPDPLSDYDFSVLIVYKAACKIVQNEAQLLASEAVMIKDGPSVLDTRTASNNMMAIASTLCKTYSDLLNEYNFMGGKNGNIKGQAVLTPYSPGSFFSVWRERYDLR